MKGRFQDSSHLSLGSIQSHSTSRLEKISQQSQIINQLSQLGTRLSRAALIVPFVMSGMGYFSQPAQAQVRIVQRIGDGNSCPTGTIRGTSNFLVNGSFATNAGTGIGVETGPAAVPPSLGFTSVLPYRGDGVYPNDDIGGLSIQTGNVTYGGGDIVVGQPFPGDPANRVPAFSTYLYSNPNAAVTSPGTAQSAFPNPIIWQQTVTGLQPNTTYNFIAYFYNLLRTDAVLDAEAPKIVLRIDTPSRVLAGPETPVTTRQQWTPVQYTFTTGAGETTATLSIIDQANSVFGDDFGLTAIGLNQCIPGPEIYKSVRRLRDNDNNGILNVGDDLEYTILVRNPSTESITELVIGDAIPTGLQVLQDGSNSIQFPSGYSAATTLPSTSFNGTGSPITLTTAGTLAAGATITLKYNARILPEASSQLVNQARANFNGDGGVPLLSDASDSTNPGQPGSGNNPGIPDANGNVNQANNTRSDATVVNLGTPPTSNRLRLVKRITAASRGGIPISGLSFTDVVADTDANAINEAGLRPVGLSEIPASIPLQSGDDVQYTIYFLAEQSLENLNFCDLIPTGTSYLPNSISIVGAGTNADQGRFFSPLTSLEQVAGSSACANLSNPNGTVIVNLGTVPSGRVGSVSLRVKIN